jgi:hypothetical protein
MASFGISQPCLRTGVSTHRIAEFPLGYPLVMSKKLLKIAIEIVDLLMKHGDFPLRFLYVYQRVLLFPE